MNFRQKLGSWLLKPELKKIGKTLPFVPRWRDKKPVWTNWSVDKAVKDGLKASVWVYRCINRRANSVASVPWYVEERKGDVWEVVPNHPIAVLLDEPNPFMSGQSLVQYMVNHLDLGGNAIWHINRVQNAPVELWPIIPDPKRIKPIPDRQRYISHYEYTVDPGDKIRLEPEEIVHFRFIDPGNLYWGLSPLQVAARTVDTDVEAVNWNKISLQNRAVTDGVFAFDHPLTEEQWEEARKMVREQHQGAGNARTPWVLGAGAKWNQMSLSPVEMDFLESRRFSRQEICAVFDVPTLLVGATEASTYNNYATARKAFWEDTMVPLLDDIREALNLALVPYWDPDLLDPSKQANLRVMYDVSNIPALQENFTEKVGNARTLWQMGVPLNMINRRLELGFPEIPGGDEPRVTTGFMYAAGDGPDETKGTWTEEQKTLFWKARDEDKLSWEEKVAQQIAALFQAEGELIVAGFEENGKIGALAEVEGNTTVWEEALAAVYTAVIEHFGQLEGERIAGEAAKRRTAPTERKFDFDPYAELVNQFVVHQAALKVTYMSTTTKTKIAMIIDKALADSETIPQIAARIRRMYLDWATGEDSGIDYPRSLVIARTEVGAASGYGSYNGAVQAEQQIGVAIEKEWISSRDERVRDSHDYMDGERKGLKELFSNGLMYPGDPNGLAEETIMCRCVMANHVIG